MAMEIVDSIMQELPKIKGGISSGRTYYER
jgi:hypothetical protein